MIWVLVFFTSSSWCVNGWIYFYSYVCCVCVSVHTHTHTYIYILGVARYMYSYRTVTVQASQFGAWCLTTNTGNSPPIQKGAPVAMQRCLITASRRTANANGDTEAAVLMFGSLYFILINIKKYIFILTSEINPAPHFGGSPFIQVWELCETKLGAGNSVHCNQFSFWDFWENGAKPENSRWTHHCIQVKYRYAIAHYTLTCEVKCMLAFFCFRTWFLSHFDSLTKRVCAVLYHKHCIGSWRKLIG